MPQGALVRMEAADKDFAMCSEVKSVQAEPERSRASRRGATEAQLLWAAN